METEARLTRASAAETWGFTLTGGREHFKPLVVAKVRPSSPAGPHLQPGARLLRVNGCDVTHSRHNDVTYMIRNAGDTLSLTVTQ